MLSYIGRGRGDEVADRDIVDVGDGVEGCLGVVVGHHDEIWVDLGWEKKISRSVAGTGNRKEADSSRFGWRFVHWAAGTESTLGRNGPGSGAQKHSFVILLIAISPVVVDKE